MCQGDVFPACLCVARSQAQAGMTGAVQGLDDAYALDSCLRRNDGLLKTS
jgi:hypothetical protein